MTPKDLNEASLEEAMQAIREHPEQRIALKPDRLHIPMSLIQELGQQGTQHLMAQAKETLEKVTGKEHAWNYDMARNEYHLRPVGE